MCSMTHSIVQSCFHRWNVTKYMYFTFTEDFRFCATKWMDEKGEMIPRDTDLFNFQSELKSTLITRKILNIRSNNQPGALVSALQYLFFFTILNNVIRNDNHSDFCQIVQAREEHAICCFPEIPWRCNFSHSNQGICWWPNTMTWTKAQDDRG